MATEFQFLSLIAEDRRQGVELFGSNLWESRQLLHTIRGEFLTVRNIHLRFHGCIHDPSSNWRRLALDKRNEEMAMMMIMMMKMKLYLGISSRKELPKMEGAVDLFTALPFRSISGGYQLF